MSMLTPERIRKIRLALGLTAAEFAARLGVSEDCVWKWERGNRHPTYKRMIALNKIAMEARKHAASTIHRFTRSRNVNRRATLSIAFIGVNLMACCCGNFGQQQAKPVEQEIVEAKEAPVKEKPKPVKEFTPEPEKPKFLLVGESTILDGIKVEILSGSVGQIELKTLAGRTTYKTPMSYFQLRLRITNETETELINYAPWHGETIGLGRESKMSDEFNNTYHAWHGGFSSQPVGDFSRYTRLDPGKSLIDTVAFETPIDRATELTITLQGSSVGRHKSSIVYRMPRSFFEKK
jgi:DNA-binding XRE family transcriptional regulator